jgi:hypothetical protein
VRNGRTRSIERLIDRDTLNVLKNANTSRPEPRLIIVVARHPTDCHALVQKMQPGRAQDSLSLCAGWALIRRGETGDLSTLCEGFLQPPPCAFCTTTSQTHGLISGPASRSHVAWTSSRSDVVLHYHRPGAPLFMSDIPGTLHTKIAAHMLATTCNSNVFLYTTTREHLASPGASVSREGFAILEWTSP